jgi:hypothetical protein
MLRSLPSTSGVAHAGDHVFPGAVLSKGEVRAATGARAAVPRVNGR